MKQPIIYSSNPEALKAADPAKLTEAQRAYRDLLIRKDIERLTGRGAGQSEAYLRELGIRLAQQHMPVAAEPTEDELKEAAPQPKKNDVFA